MEPTNTKKLVVLIVDDSMLIIERMMELLNDMDNIQVVVYADNYKEGVQLLENIKPDVVLLDINLPDKSGIELLRHIHNHQEPPTVIMITNQVTDHYRKICESLGAQYFIDKSNDFDLIPETIASIKLPAAE
jgi:DNA-binding NarL/FixJ family response regulator